MKSWPATTHPNPTTGSMRRYYRRPKPKEPITTDPYCERGFQQDSSGTISPNELISPGDISCNPRRPYPPREISESECLSIITPPLAPPPPPPPPSAMDIDIFQGWPSPIKGTRKKVYILPLPQPKKPNIPERYEDQLFHAATIALNSYNSKHQFHFELAHPLYMKVFRAPSKSSCPYPVTFYTHLSFIARSQESSGTLKLFFAELCDYTTVKSCVPVERGNPFFPLGCEECHPEGVIYHPLGKYKAGGYRDFESPPPGELAKLEASAKTFLEEKYTFKYVIQDLYPEEEKKLKRVNNRYARNALASYEEDTKSSFQFLELMACVRFSDEHVLATDLDCKVYAHLTFLARNKDPRCIDSPAELFFAELNLDYGWVTTCVKVKEAGSFGCAVCERYCPMPHPEGELDDLEYEAGIKGGTFADAQVKDRSYGAKVELQEKLGDSSNAARFIGLSSVLSAKQNGVISSPRKVDCQVFSTNCIKA